MTEEHLWLLQSAVDKVMKMSLKEQSASIKIHGRAAWNLDLDSGTLLRNPPLEQIGKAHHTWT